MPVNLRSVVYTNRREFGERDDVVGGVINEYFVVRFLATIREIF